MTYQVLQATPGHREYGNSEEAVNVTTRNGNGLTSRVGLTNGGPNLGRADGRMIMAAVVTPGTPIQSVKFKGSKVILVLDIMDVLATAWHAPVRKRRVVTRPRP